MADSQTLDLESRMVHLLQPTIRDLTKNWEVDIAGILEDYIEQIGSIAITFDGGKTRMNFAEAALLIQGSACVYGRKVEYLYTLVCQVLDLLSSKKKLQKDAAANDESGENIVNKDEDEEFLSLDDLQEHKNIELKNDDAHISKEKTAEVLPRTPIALLTFEDAEKGEHPLLSKGGELLGNRLDFKMNTSNVHPSGTVLLDLSHLNLLNFSLNCLATSTPFVPQRTTAVAQCISDQEDEGHPNDISMDDDAPFPNPVDGEQDILETTPAKIMIGKSERRKVHFQAAKPTINPWEPMDPHHSDVGQDKAFKKGKVFRLPANLKVQESQKRKRGKQKAKTAATLEPITEFCLRTFNSKLSNLSLNPLKLPSFLEYEDLFWKEFKRRQTNLRNIRKKMRERGRFVEQEEEEEEREEDEYNPDPMVPEDDNDDDVGVIEFPLNAVDQEELHVSMSPADRLSMDMDEAVAINSYEALVRNYVEGYLASAEQYAQITELTKRVMEWEDKIRPVLNTEEKQGVFDIHTYGSLVIDHFHEPSEWLSFRKVIQNKPSYEVCRTFLATLQLANNLNVEIASDGDMEQGMDTMRLKLLTKTRHFQQLEDYLAPSIQTS